MPNDSSFVNIVLSTDVGRSKFNRANMVITYHLSL